MYLALSLAWFAWRRLASGARHSLALRILGCHLGFLELSATSCDVMKGEASVDHV